MKKWLSIALLSIVFILFIVIIGLLLTTIQVPYISVRNITLLKPDENCIQKNTSVNITPALERCNVTYTEKEEEVTRYCSALKKLFGRCPDKYDLSDDIIASPVIGVE